MNCPTCGKIVPGLACEACANLKFYQAVRQSQRHYLADLKKDRVHFYAVRRGSSLHAEPWHLMLFGDRAHSYCGEEFLRPIYSNRTHLGWQYLKDHTREVCERCLDQLRALTEAAKEPA